MSLPKIIRTSNQLNFSDPFGPTCLAYTPNGKSLITAGANSVVRVYMTGSDGEPTNIDDCQENNLAIAAAVDTKENVVFVESMADVGLE